MRHFPLGRVQALAVAGLLLCLGSLDAAAHERPLGDGKISTAPKLDHLMACQTSFNPNAPGAARTGPWITGSTYDPTKKPRVDGAVTWPSEISISRRGGERTVRANNLPSHPTGVFPIARSDDAYRYDRNPNRIEPQDILLKLPALPKEANAASCVPMGMIGFALSGAAIYNAVDARGRDAPAYEIQDDCGGHPQRQGQYHYHDRSTCLEDRRSQPGGHSDLLGYALDGFGIFGIHGESGKPLTNADLDACHGHRHEVVWDGAPAALYHYHMTDAYPYTLGCFRGTPLRRRVGLTPPPRREGRPPGPPPKRPRK